MLYSIAFSISVWMFCLWCALSVLSISGFLHRRQRLPPLTEQEKSEIGEFQGLSWRKPTVWAFAFFCWPVLVTLYLDDSWQRSLPALDAANVQSLEKTAEEWWRHGERPRTIPEDEWPLELSRLVPLNVTVADEGVFMQFGSGYVKAWGVFILPNGSDFQPLTDTEPSFDLLQGRCYRYEVNG